MAFERPTPDSPVYIPINVKLFIDIRNKPGVFRGKYDIFKIVEGILGDHLGRTYERSASGYSNIHLHPFLLGFPGTFTELAWEQSNGSIQSFLTFALFSKHPELVYDGYDEYKPTIAAYTDYFRLYIISPIDPTQRFIVVSKKINKAYEATSWFDKSSSMYDKYFDKVFLPKISKAFEMTRSYKPDKYAMIDLLQQIGI